MTMGNLIDVLVFTLGLVACIGIVLSAVAMVVVPRATPLLLPRAVFRAVLWLFRLWNARVRSWAQREQAYSHLAPASLLIVAVVWLVVILFGYTAMYWALGVRPLRAAFTLSGSSLLTLGFAVPHALPTGVLTFTEAGLGLLLLALLITYLPTMYAAFSRREALVTELDVRAGVPPSAAEMLARFHVIQGFERLEPMWRAWERWFVELEESHTSFPAIALFRSPQPHRSWVTAAGAILDAASFTASTVDRPAGPDPQLCIRAGYLALRRIARGFNISFDPDPAPDGPISVTRGEYDQVYDRLAELGVPLKADRDQAWRDFAGWRVNYDTVLLDLAGLTMAPYAPWSSDRSNYRRPPLRRRQPRQNGAAPRSRLLDRGRRDRTRG
jgi:hypothetical protein